MRQKKGSEPMQLRRFISLLFIIVFVLSSGLTGLQAEVEYFHGSWQEAKSKAQRENKPIFLKAYANWCGPCIHMENTVFNKGEVAQFYNQHFINFKLNIDTDEGIALKETYGIYELPDFLFFNPNTEVIVRRKGEKSARQMVDIGKVVVAHPHLAKNNQSSYTASTSSTYISPSYTKPTPTLQKAKTSSKSLEQMQHRWMKGSRNVHFLHEFAYTLKGHNLAYTEVANLYLKKQVFRLKSLKNEQNTVFIYTFSDDVRSQAMCKLIKHKNHYIQRYGQKNVDDKIRKAIRNGITTAANYNNESLFKHSLKVLNKSKIENKKDYKLDMQWRYHELRKDWESFVKLINKYTWSSKVDPAKLNVAAWTMLDNCKDQKLLCSVKRWCRRSIRLDNNSYNNEALGYVYYELGKKKLARKHLNIAIEKAQLAGRDASASYKLLDKIERGVF